MSLFEDIGRTNTLSATGQNILSGVKGLADTQLRMKQQAFDDSIKLADENRKAEAFRKQKEFEDSPYNVKLSPLLSVYEPGTPEYQETYDRLAKGSNADEYGNTTKGNYMKGVAIYSQDADAFTKTLNVKKQQLYDALAKAREELNNARMSGDEEKTKKASAKVEALSMKVITAEGKIAEYTTQSNKQKIEDENKKRDDERARKSQLETERHNKETAFETRRHNKELEAEAKRKMAETERHNREWEKIRKEGKEGKQLDEETAQMYLDAVNGDVDKAREMAKKDGYKF